MSEIAPLIETMEHRWMRAWVTSDMKTLKSLTFRNFQLLTGTKPATLLDYKSLVEAAGSRYRCTSYRFGNIYARTLGPTAIFATQLELQATLDDVDWSGELWLTDVWLKSRVRRKWLLAQRVMSAIDRREDVPAGIRSMQLWR